MLAGTGLGLLHAYDGVTGRDAPGFPKITGGWLFAPAALSDDGRLAGITREGFLFEWSAPEAPACQGEWPSFRHDPQGSGNYDRDGTAPATPDHLSLPRIRGNTFRLRFRSPGDDVFCGTANRYVADMNGRTLNLGAPAPGFSTFTKEINVPDSVRRVTIRAADGPAGQAFNLGAPGALARSGPNDEFREVPQPGTSAAGRRRPRLALKLRYRAGRTHPRRKRVRPRRCARSGVRVTVVGRDRRLGRRATFRVARRVLRDRRRPLSRVFRDRHRGRSHVHRVRVGVRLRDGRLVRLSKRYRVCAETRRLGARRRR